MYDFTFVHRGVDFCARLEHDSSAEAPWDGECGHGPVTNWERRAKRPGEWVLSTSRECKRFYDAQAAVRQAKEEGWGLDEKSLKQLASRLKREPTARQIRAEAVRLDFERLRAWCNDAWHYVGVCVSRVVDGEPEDDGYTHALWGVESDSKDYIREVAADLADEILTEQAKTVYAGATVEEI